MAVCVCVLCVYARTSQPSCGEFWERLSCLPLTGPPASRCPPRRSDTQPRRGPPAASTSSVWPGARSGTEWGSPASARSHNTAKAKNNNSSNNTVWLNLEMGVFVEFRNTKVMMGVSVWLNVMLLCLQTFKWTTAVVYKKLC